MLDKIRSLTAGKASSKTAIANYLLDHLATIEQQSLEELAQLTFTSKASLVRFAQSLGFKGWTDFLPALVAARYYSATHYSQLDHSLPFTQDDDTASIVQKIATIEKESIQDTADRMDVADLDKATSWIQEARRILILGLSPNEYIAHLFKRKMLTIGKPVEVARPGEFGLCLSSLTKDDLVILISYSGNSQTMETLRYLPLLKTKQIRTIGLTSDKGRYLQAQTDISFRICTQEDQLKKIGNFSTEASILYILNTLYALYFKKDYFANYIKKIKLSASLEEDR